MEYKNEIETERKFLVKYLPKNYKKNRLLKIEQAYIEFAPKEHRVRKKNDIYLETFKGEGELSRTEEEIEITKEQYDSLLQKKVSRLIVKDRYMIPIKKKLTAELNIYKNELKGLFVIEVEFDSLDDSYKFKPLEWFGTEVTYDKKLKNQSLATLDLMEIENLPKEYPNDYFGSEYDD